jgi:hypothetical protein
LAKKDINMGEMVDKGDVNQIFQFGSFFQANNVQLFATFRIDSGTEFTPLKQLPKVQTVEAGVKPTGEIRGEENLLGVIADKEVEIAKLQKQMAVLMNETKPARYASVEVGEMVNLLMYARTRLETVVVKEVEKKVIEKVIEKEVDT